MPDAPTIRIRMTRSSHYVAPRTRLWAERCRRVTDGAAGGDRHGRSRGKSERDVTRPTRPVGVVEDGELQRHARRVRRI
jgi:hypothetical protein